MSETFGHSWFHNYGSVPNSAWVDGLSDLSVDDIRFGLEALKAWKGDYPPNMLQFRALCRPVIEESHKIYQRLPEPEEHRAARKANGLAHIASLREEGRYREWLQDNAGRIEADYDMHMRTVRSWIFSAKKSSNASGMCDNVAI
jgi:hypothetical protein